MAAPPQGEEHLYVSAKVPWARVFVEGIVIVVSILLAFGVDAFWDRRSDAEAERRYLRLLDRDLGLMVDQLNESLDYEEGRASAANRAYDALSGGADLENEELSEALTLATQRRTLDPPRATYQDLINTGNLRVIRNPDLRDSLIRFYEAADVGYEVIRKNLAVYVDGLTVEAVFGQGLIRGSFPGYSTSFDYRGYAEPPDRIWSLPRDSEEVARLRAALHLRGGVGTTIQQPRIIQAANELRAQIQSELSSRWDE